MVRPDERYIIRLLACGCAACLDQVGGLSMDVFEEFETWLREGGHGKKGADHYVRGARLFVAFLNGNAAAAMPWRDGADPLERKAV